MAVNVLTRFEQVGTSLPEGTYRVVRGRTGRVETVEAIDHRRHHLSFRAENVWTDGTVKSEVSCTCDLGRELRLSGWEQSTVLR